MRIKVSYNGRVDDTSSCRYLAADLLMESDLTDEAYYKAENRLTMLLENIFRCHRYRNSCTYAWSADTWASVIVDELYYMFKEISPWIDRGKIVLFLLENKAK